MICPHRPIYFFYTIITIMSYNCLEIPCFLEIKGQAAQLGQIHSVLCDISEMTKKYFLASPPSNSTPELVIPNWHLQSCAIGVMA